MSLAKEFRVKVDILELATGLIKFELVKKYYN